MCSKSRKYITPAAPRCAPPEFSRSRLGFGHSTRRVGWGRARAQPAANSTLVASLALRSAPSEAEVIEAVPMASAGASPLCAADETTQAGVVAPPAPTPISHLARRAARKATHLVQGEDWLQMDWRAAASAGRDAERVEWPSDWPAGGRSSDQLSRRNPGELQSARARPHSSHLICVQRPSPARSTAGCR